MRTVDGPDHAGHHRATRAMWGVLFTMVAACGSGPATDSAKAGTGTSSSIVTQQTTTLTPTSTTSTTTSSTTTALSPSTTSAPATTAACAANLIAAVQAKVGSEYVGGSTPVDGGVETGGEVIALHHPPEPGTDAALGIHAYGDCRMIALEVLVRYEGQHPVWRLADVVAVPPLHGAEFIGPACTTAAYLAQGQRPANAIYAAVAKGDDPTEDSYAASFAWQVVGERLVAASPADIRCPKGMN